MAYLKGTMVKITFFYHALVLADQQIIFFLLVYPQIAFVMCAVHRVQQFSTILLQGDVFIIGKLLCPKKKKKNTFTINFKLYC